MRALLGDRVREVTARRERLTVDCFDTAEQFRDFFKACYGPTMAVYRSIGRSPTIPSGCGPWIRPWQNWVAGTTSGPGRWYGSICWSPPVRELVVGWAR